MARVRRAAVWSGLALIAMVGMVRAQEAARKEVVVYGQKISYLEAGSGPPVILLHGLGAEAANWSLTIPALAARFRVLAPDQIGFGQSDKPLINYRVGTLVDFLDGFCQKVGISKATLVGNSLGGWTAMAFALAHPEKVERLVLVGSAGYSFDRAGGPKLTREMMLALNPSTLAGQKQTLNLIFYNKAMVTDQVAEQAFVAKLRSNNGHTVNQFIDSFLRGEDFLDGKLGAIKVPTLLVWGREDALTSLASGQMLAKDIAGSELVIIDRCGHVPQLECAGAFNAALNKFLSAAPAAQSRAAGK